MVGTVTHNVDGRYGGTYSVDGWYTGAYSLELLDSSDYKAQNYSQNNVLLPSIILTYHQLMS